MESKTIQMRGRGTLTLPASIRERYGLEDGDPLTLIDLDGALVISPRLSVIGKLAAEIEYLTKEAGLTLDQLLVGIKEQRARYVADLVDREE
jgi:bifunctional DNA-binding transcriptional regulator/antitoxin component of YhaV-PrlF toxin-antitoxin module